jgi:hypothetical protein
MSRITVAALALMALSAADAGPHPLGRYCDGQVVVTGTLAGARMVGDIASANPAMAQGAALLARLPADQQPQIKPRVQRKLRETGRYNDDVFALLYEEARAGNQMAYTAAGVLGGTTGAILGVVTGSVVDNAVGSGGLGALGGAVLAGRGGTQLARESVGSIIKIEIDSRVGPVLAELFRHPCEMTAEQALRRIEAP